MYQNSRCKLLQHYYRSQNYQIGVSSRQVAALSGSQAAPILNLTHDMVIADLQDDHGDQTVVDEDPFARTQNLEETFLRADATTTSA